MKKNLIVSGILIDPNSRILLIKRKFSKKNLPNHWSFPGGTHEEGESPEETAIREVKEEVGLDFEVTRLFSEEEGGDISNYFYRFLGNYSGIIKIQDEECDGYGWFSYDETVQLLIYSKVKNVLERLREENLIK